MPKYPNPAKFRIDSLKIFYCIMHIPMGLCCNNSDRYRDPNLGDLEVLTLDRSGEKFGFDELSYEKRGKVLTVRKIDDLYHLLKAGKFEEVLSQEDWNKLFDSMIVRVQVLPEGGATFEYVEICRCPLDNYYMLQENPEFRKWCSELPGIKNNSIIRFEEKFFVEKKQ